MKMFSIVGRLEGILWTKLASNESFYNFVFMGLKISHLNSF